MTFSAPQPKPATKPPSADTGSEQPILELSNISKRFTKRIDIAARLLNLAGATYKDKVVHAVDRVDLQVARGEVVGLIGESGCGKSTLGRVVAGIHQPSDGTLAFKGRNLASMAAHDALDASIKIQMIFQDPMSSLNPRKRVIDTVGEAPVFHGIVQQNDIEDYVDQLLERVGLNRDAKRRLPHQFSGGQRQRIGIARALAVQPEFLVCDEAVAALDVSIQAQILNLFMDLRTDFDLTYLFISHDLGVVHHIADRIVIMYLGRVVEMASNADLFSSPNHPYTQALLADVPRIDRRRQTYTPIKGELPSPLNPPTGCHFHPRCPFAMKRCSEETPKLREIAPGRLSACHLNDG
ncbi:ABC transporter ATP-binding protein [Roseobacter sp.]|uniref:ABC transporter ATP-binding protein n=1 Tax=Roseobacter sp. TaxID=1907202 RepID=UPI00385CCCD4